MKNETKRKIIISILTIALLLSGGLLASFATQPKAQEPANSLKDNSFIDSKIDDYADSDQSSHGIPKIRWENSESDQATMKPFWWLYNALKESVTN